jgi:hypothetical protein
VTARQAELDGIIGVPHGTYPPGTRLVMAVEQPSVRHPRGGQLPRRTHVGGHVRPGARRVTTGARAGPSDDPDLGDEPPRETPAEQVARRLRQLEAFVAEHGLTYWDGQYGVSR